LNASSQSPRFKTAAIDSTGQFDDPEPYNIPTSRNDQSGPGKRPRVLLCCSGVGIINRGIETFFREAADGLRQSGGVEALLLKGAGKQESGDLVVSNLPRTGRCAKLLGGLVRRNGYVIEQWSTLLPIVFQIRRFRPQVIFYSDSNLGFLLHRFRGYIGVNYRLLFSNGGPCHPPFSRYDFVHQVTPVYYEEALAAGEPRDKHFFIPYGIRVPNDPPRFDPMRQREVRRYLGLPQERPVIVSVGWIAKQQKRMDYLIEEVARLPNPRPFLHLVGAMDSASGEIVDLGRQLLGSNGFAVASVSPDEIAAYYRAADVFALASLQEGFGRVYLEALMHGLPVVAHRHPVTEYVIGREETLVDLNSPGSMAEALSAAMAAENGDSRRRRRWESVRNRFSWQKLARDYVKMFQTVAKAEVPRCR
jgi:1,2-diacylglycerol 3-alpha-glucosyltransferase